jgi:hypothetical protein
MNKEELILDTAKKVSSLRAHIKNVSGSIDEMVTPTEALPASYLEHYFSDLTQIMKYGSRKVFTHGLKAEKTRALEAIPYGHLQRTNEAVTAILDYNPQGNLIRYNESFERSRESLTDKDGKEVGCLLDIKSFTHLYFDLVDAYNAHGALEKGSFWDFGK